MRGSSALEEALAALRRADTDAGRAAPAAERALRRATAEADPAAASIAERAWGRANLQCGDVDSAIRHLRRALALASDAGSPVLAGEARIPLAAALVQRGKPDEALSEIDTAVPQLDAAGSARARAQRADLLHQIGRLGHARAEYEAAIPALRRAGDTLNLQRALVNRGIFHTERHDFAAAEADLREADGLARALGRGLAVGIIAENLGFLETLRGDVPAALAHLGRAERIIGDRGGQLGPVHSDQAELLLSVGARVEAAAAAERAVHAFTRERRRLLVPGARLLLAQAAHLGGDWPTAEHQARRAHREFTRQDRREWAELAWLAVLKARLAADAQDALSRESAASPLSREGAGAPPAPESAGPPLTRKGVGPPPALEGAGSPLAHKGAEAPLSRESAGSPPAPESAGPPLTRGGSGPPPAREGAGSPPAREGAGSPLSREGAGAPLLSESAGTPLAQKGAGAPLSSESPGSPLAQKGAGAPLSRESAGPPLGREGAGPPLDQEGAGPPPARESAGPPPAWKGAEPPPAREGAGPPLDREGVGVRLALSRESAGVGRRARVRAARAAAMVGVLSSAGWPAAALEARLVAARLAEDGGDHDGAVAHLRAAAAGTTRGGPAALRARRWYARSVLARSAGDSRAATRAVRAGLRILDEHASALGATDLRARSAAHRAELSELGLRIALESGRPARVFEWAERGRANRLANRPLRPPEDPELVALLAELRGTLARLPGGHGADRARQALLERQIRDRARLSPGAPRPPVRPVKPADLALGDAALVEFVQLNGTLHALSLVDGVLRLRLVGATAAVASSVDRITFALRRLAHRTAPAAVRAAARQLLRATAATLDDVLLRAFPELGGRQLVVVPTGPLHSVPWSVLPSCSGRPVTVSPSATLWHSAAARRSAGLGAVSVAAGPELRGAYEEAQAVAALHGTTPLVGDAATVEAVLKAVATADVLHLAAHGRLAVDQPLLSDLRLHDGPLVVHDLEQLDRAPRTVVLASCDSGRSVVCTGDELLGLSATFMALGTAQLVASVVPVPDRETTPLMIAFHRNLAAGQPPAVALATAQESFRDDETGSFVAAAGFSCLGAGH